MHTARSLTVSRSIRRGGPAHLPPRLQTPYADPGCRPPGCRPPWMQTPWMQTSRLQTPLDTDPLDADPLCGQTNTCENITLPETSFACRNNRDIETTKPLPFYYTFLFLIKVFE